MSFSKPNTNTKNNPYNNNQYPLIKPSYLNKQNNQQRLKQIYKSTSGKEKQKSKNKNGRKYNLPLPDRKLQENNHNGQYENHMRQIQKSFNKAGRYKEYLQLEQTDKHYLKNQQQILLNQRYQPKTTRLYGESQQNRKIDVSSNLQIKTHFRRKVSSQFQNQSLSSRKRQSAQLLQKQLYQLNQNLKNNNKKNNKNTSKFISKLQDKNIKSQYQGTNSRHDNIQYHKEAFKIRRSTNEKKSFSGSINKKPSQDNIRQNSQLQNFNNKNNVNSSGTKSHLSSPKHLLLQEGKKHLKNGNFSQAIKTFQRGKQQQPKNLQFNYNIALIYLKSHKYQQGLKILEEIIESNPNFKKTVYLFAVISLKNINQIQKAIQMANKGLTIFDNNGFLDLIFYRGKLYKEMGDYEKSLKDIQKVISIQKDHIQALYYAAFLYFHQQLINHAMSTLSAAIYYDQNKRSQMRIQALKLRAKVYLSQGKVKQAKKDIQKVIERSGNSSQMYYLMGKVLMLENNVNNVTDGLINFEKCLRHKSKQEKIENHNINNTTIISPAILFTSSPKNYLISSLLQICKTKIDIKDFYSAYHHINRSKHLSGQIDENDWSLKRFKYFIQGVVFLMKRKIDEGMKNFEKFIQIQQKLEQNLIKNFPTPTKEGQQQQLKKNPFNPSKTFQKSQLKKQIQYFYPAFYLYRGFGYFMQNKHQLAIKDYEQYEKSQSLDKYTMYNLLLARGIEKINKREFDKAIEYFNKAGELFVKTQSKKVQPFIYRAIASIQSARNYNQQKQTVKKTQQQQLDDNNEIKVLQLVFDALKQLDKAHDINDANSNLLFIRSLIYAYLNKYEESLDDIIKGISKSQENVPKYFFFRGLIHSTMQNKKQAMNDFNIAVNLDGNYAPVYFQRAKLSFQIENYSKAFQDLAKYSQLKPQEDEQFHKSALYLINGIYPMAQQSSQLIKDKHSLQYRQLRFHILVKLGKLKQAEQLLREQQQQQNVLQITDISLLKIIQNSDLTDIFTNIDNQQKIINPHLLSSSRLKYFNAINYYHLLGIAYFNMGQYQRALEEFTIALKECSLRDMERGFGSGVKFKNVTNQQNDENNNNLGDKDANCIVYNIFLCHLKLNDLRKAYQVFIKQIMPVDEKLQKSQFMANFSHLLFQAMKRSSYLQKNRQQKQQQQNPRQQQNSILQLQTSKRQITQDKQQAHVQLFTNSITDKFSKQIIIQMSTFLLRTRLSLLNIDCERLRKQYSGKLWPQYVLTWLNVKEVENRPQPPWVKRLSSVDQGLVFTDQVQNINIEFQTTQHDQEDEQQQQLQQQQQDENQQNEQQQEYNRQNNDGQQQQSGNDQSQRQIKRRFDPRKFRDQMKLGDSIQRKLNKIVNKNNSNSNQ